MFCESVEAAHSSHDRHQAIADVLGVTKPSFRIDSQCKYGAVARGQASIYLRLPTSDTYREKIWDHAAGWMVVTEAGGRVSDIHGKDLDFSIGRKLEDNRGVVATNRHLHDAVLASNRRDRLRIRIGHDPSDPIDHRGRRIHRQQPGTQRSR